MHFFIQGFKKMLPVTTGVIPFGAVMGTVAAEAGLTLWQSVFMNIFTFAGASQLAAVDLMSRGTPILVVVITGLIINLRFILYSAAMLPVVQQSQFWTKITSAYFITDQTYAVMSAHQDRLPGRLQTLRFYFGAATAMAVAWHLAVLAGYLFGNFAPSSWSLDYAIPLSFAALLIPTLRNWKYLWVAGSSAAAALVLRALPYNLGLIASAFLAMTIAIVLTRKR